MCIRDSLMVAAGLLATGLFGYVTRRDAPVPVVPALAVAGVFTLAL